MRLREKLGLVLMGRAMLSRSLIQLSVNGQGCVPSLLFHLRPNYSGGNEENGDFLQKVPSRHCCTQCTQPFSRPLPTHTSAWDSWTLRGESGLVSCGVTAPFSWVLVHTRFCLCPPRVCFPSPVEYDWSIIFLHNCPLFIKPSIKILRYVSLGFHFLMKASVSCTT